MDAGFTAGQAVVLTGVPYKTLDYWDRSGLLSPSVAHASGKGTDRIYSFGDLVALKAAWELRRSGITLQSLRKVLNDVRDIIGSTQPLSNERLIVAGDDVVIARNDDEVISVLRQPGQLYMAKIVFNLGEVVETLHELVAAC